MHSSMSMLEQLLENTKTSDEAQPLTNEEQKALLASDFFNNACNQPLAGRKSVLQVNRELCFALLLLFLHRPSECFVQSRTVIECFLIIQH